MIAAEELRIGNWVYNLAGEPIIVRGTTHGGIWLKGFPISISEGFPKPIPLTPDILGKCGFERMRKSEWFVIKTPIFGLKELSVQIETFEVAINTTNWQVIFGHYRYLHQLQNLYYALTQTELQITL